MVDVRLREDETVGQAARLDLRSQVLAVAPLRPANDHDPEIGPLARERLDRINQAGVVAADIFDIAGDTQGRPVVVVEGLRFDLAEEEVAEPALARRHAEARGDVPSEDHRRLRRICEVALVRTAVPQQVRVVDDGDGRQMDPRRGLEDLGRLDAVHEQGVIPAEPRRRPPRAYPGATQAAGPVDGLQAEAQTRRPGKGVVPDGPLPQVDVGFDPELVQRVHHRRHDLVVIVVELDDGDLHGRTRPASLPARRPSRFVDRRARTVPSSSAYFAKPA